MGKIPNYEELEQRLARLERAIAKRPGVENSVSARRKRFQNLIDNALVGILRSTEEGKILLVNRKLANIFGFSSPQEFMEAIPNESILFLNPEDRENILQEMKEKGFVDGVEVEALGRNGRAIWISLSARVILKNSRAVFHEAFIVDVTKRKEAENSLHESEKRFRMLVEQAGDAFFIHDFNGKIFDVNRQACESLGYTREELLEMKISDVDIEVGHKRHKPRFWNSLSPGQYITFEGVHRRKDGSRFPVEVRLGRLNLGNQALFLSLTRDITERKEAEKNLKRAFEEIKALKNRLEEENIYLRQEIEIRYRHEEIIGESLAIKKVLSAAEKVAKEDTCVLILGETGTGKELLARAIHNMSPRKGRSMIKVNCAALPATLIESELFGREKGAFTGAVSKQVGRFEAADGSTIFLDEVGDLPLELQAKLLRVLQDNKFERLGSPETISVDVRVIAATNHDLAELVKEKKFRRDLYYRLNVFPITLPPLRERREDIPLLVWAFVEEFSQSMGKSIKHIPKKTMEFLQGYSWPGNVRELRNVIERALILSNGETLIIDRLETEVSNPEEIKTLEEVERQYIVKTLEKTGWRVSGRRGAAELLGLKESTLRSRMKRLDIERPR
ncbi:MAG: sigma 54-interacting transcriptional regulator [Deltaproteobacteria bacterium]|nr:sigma 54-interacting transcriptional regulator [Deltaproteobacteria bacterium]MBW2128679.1 sigma 54-interacting transcriptional regulator [Deltaproteobacteria bacterium]MBW2302742.1 sigma 54-interacting transcriptional regulator [Deltaproteobacteria bacterium]